MRVRRVHLEAVRGIDTCTIAFDDDVTVIHAPNERGKSTVIDALRLALTHKATSKAAVVKSLQPVGVDRGSLIEVEIEAGPWQLTCRKRFNRDVETVLTVHAPQAETVTGDEAHDRLRELLDPHVDWALFDALWFTQGRALEPLALATPTLTTRLDDAADTPNLRTSDDIIDRVEAAYLALFTPTGRPRKDPWLDLEGQVQSLRDALDRCTAELAQLDEDIAEHAAIEQQLPTLESELAGPLAAAVTQADALCATISQLEHRRQTAAAEHAAAQARLESCEQDHAARTALRQQLSALQAAIDVRATQLADADTATQRLDAEAAAQRQEVARRAQTVSDCRQLQRRAERTLAWFDARERRDTLEQRRQRVDAILARAADAERALDGLQVDDDAIEMIRHAARDLAVAEMQRQTSAPRVQIDAEQDLVAHINEEQRDLAAGESYAVTASDDVTLLIGDLAKVTVTPGSSTTDGGHRVDDVRRRVRELCADVGVQDVGEAERVYAQRQEHRDVLRLRDDALAAVLGDMQPAALTEAIDAATRDLARLADEQADALPTDSREMYAAAVDAARAAFDAAEAELVAAQQQRDAAVARSEEWRNQHAQLRADHARDEQDHARLTAELAQAQALRDDEALDVALRAARQAAEHTAAALAVIDEEVAAQNPDDATLAQEAAHNAQANAAARCAELRERRSRLEAALDARGARGLGEEAQHLGAQLARAEQTLRRMTQRGRAIELLRATLLGARDDAQRAYREPLRAGIVRYARLLFGVDDVDVILDEQLRISERTLHGTTLAWEQLSAGAKEQLAILSGLAAARIAGDDGVPFVLDDTLGYADPVRVERLSALLGRAEGMQVIILTCVPDRFRATGVTPTPLVVQD